MTDEGNVQRIAVVHDPLGLRVVDGGIGSGVDQRIARCGRVAVGVFRIVLSIGDGDEGEIRTGRGGCCNATEEIHRLRVAFIVCQSKV